MRLIVLQDIVRMALHKDVVGETFRTDDDELNLNHLLVCHRCVKQSPGRSFIKHWMDPEFSFPFTYNFFFHKSSFARNISPSMLMF